MEQTRFTTADGFDCIRRTYHSMDEFIDAAAEHRDEYRRKGSGNDQAFLSPPSDTQGGTVRNLDDAVTLARAGWDGAAEASLSIVDDALDKVETQTDDIVLQPVYDVTGSEVDVGLFLHGEPECMVEQEPLRVSRAGRVVSISAGVLYSGGTSAKRIAERGALITALIVALERTGHAVELWAEVSVSARGSGPGNKKRGETRVLVKSARDELDLGRVMFAMCHPAMARALWFAESFCLPAAFKKALSVGGSYGGSNYLPTHDLPEGTVYLPSLIQQTGFGGVDLNMDSVADLMKIMVGLGLIDEDA